MAKGKGTAPAKTPAKIVEPVMPRERRSNLIETDYGTCLVTLNRGANDSFYTVQFVPADDDIKVEVVGSRLVVSRPAKAKSEVATEAQKKQ